MKNFDSMIGGFEKMGSRRDFKKDKPNQGKNSSRSKHNNEDYEEYFNTRYGNKLYK